MHVISQLYEQLSQRTGEDRKLLERYGFQFHDPDEEPKRIRLARKRSRQKRTDRRE